MQAGPNHWANHGSSALRQRRSFEYPVRNHLPPGIFFVDAFDIEVHAQDLTVVEMVAAFAWHSVAVLIGDWAFERMQRAGFDRRFGVHGHLLHVIRHVCVWRHLH